MKIGFKVRGDISKLSPTEKEILSLLTDDCLTIKQAAIRRKTSIQAVYKIVTQLKDKGAITRCLKRVEKEGGGIQPFNQKIRLHGQQFKINILFMDHRYHKIRDKCNTIDIDGNTIRLHSNKLEIYSHASFYADDVATATADSMKYWQRILHKLEHDLKIILVKPRAQNIKLVKVGHYAETNNELAKECEQKAHKVNIHTTEDGKLWFTVDNSFNLHEAETLHPQTAKEDMQEAVRPFFNDLRDHRPPVLSDIMGVINKMAQTLQDQAEVNKETAAGLNSIVTFVKSQLPDPGKEIRPKDRPDYMG